MIRHALLCALTAATLTLLTACGKTIAFTEEVRLQPSGRKISIEREAHFEPRITGLELGQRWVRSELRVLGGDIPPWDEKLFPMYLGAAGQEGYLLVAFIPNAMICYERGRPNSKYVAFLGNKQGWREVEVPKELEGQPANLLLGVEGRNFGDTPLSPERKTVLNRLAGFQPNEKVIQLGSRYGC